MQDISELGNFTVSIQLSHRGTMTMFQSPALYQPPAVSKHNENLLEMKNRDYIFLSIARNKKRKFYLDEILYLKADNTYTTLKMQNSERFIISKPLKYFEKMLFFSSFCKINRSIILNPHHVIELDTGCDPCITLINNERLSPDKCKIKQIETYLIASQAENQTPTS